MPTAATRARPEEPGGATPGPAAPAGSPRPGRPPKQARPPRGPRLDEAGNPLTATARLRHLLAQRRSDELLPQYPSNASAFRRRYGVPYDTQGPKVRMGVLWALAVVLAAAPQDLRPWGLAVLYGVVAGAAAAQVVDSHTGDRHSPDRAVAAFGGSALSVAATLGAAALGVGYLALVVVALVVAAATRSHGHQVVARAGQVVAAAGICGGAAASLVLLAQYEIGALIILLVFVMVYDASDFIVGSGASNGLEGPVAGMIFIGAAAAVAAGLGVPPFNGADIWSFAVLAMIACPAGQLLGSAMMPTANERAPALRRIDSLLVVAPLWAWLVGLYLTRPG